MRDSSTTSWVINTREIEAMVQTLRRGRCCRFIGPRYQRKSVIMRHACKYVDEELGYFALYVSLRDARPETEAAFYTSLGDLMATRARQYYRLSLPCQEIRKPADLQRLLATLPTQWRNHVVLFVDDLELEVVPPDYIGELLRVLRVAFEDSREWRFLSVVCASHNLAWAALGPTSPFFSVSDLVLLSDLTPAETAQWVRRQLSALHCPAPNARALDYLYQQTAGDRWLVNEICQEVGRWRAPHPCRNVTVRVVKAAIESWLRRSGQTTWLDSIHELEGDPQRLEALLLLMEHGEMLANQLPLPLSRPPDPLLTSGFVTCQGSRYRIKSDLHYRLLQRALTPERIGQLFLAAGDYERAMARLRGNVRAVNEIEERSQVMLSFISAMYTTATKEDAFQQLAQGLQATYPQQTFRLYDYDSKRESLVPIPASDTAPRRIACSAQQRPEVKALSTPAEYYWTPSVDQRRTLFIPLRVNGEKVGLVVVENLLTRRNFQRRQGQVRELLTYLQYAARALKNRREFEQLYSQAEQRARDLRYLLELTRELMKTRAPFNQVLQQTLRTAIKALRGRAQMGSIYLYDSHTGELTIKVDTGYPSEIRPCLHFRPGEGVVGYVYAKGRPYIVNDTVKDSRYRVLPKSDVNIRSMMGIPLSARQRRLGVLCLDNLKHTGAFDDESKRLMMIFANHVTLWLERVRLIEQLRYRHDTARAATGLVHQIKNAVASIPDVTEEIEVALREDQHSTLSECVSELRDKALVTSSLSRWLDRFARTWELQLETVDLSVLVTCVCQRMDKHRPAHISLQQSPVHDGSLTVRCDRTLIEILLENLIENAFEALHSLQTGQVLLTVKGDKQYGEVKVWNNGPAISPAHWEKIWEAGWTTKDTQSDTPLRGLGLSLCRYIAQAHEGTLTLEDSIMKGVAFVLRLPLRGPSWMEEVEDETGATYFIG